MSSFHVGFERATPNDNVFPLLMSVAVELLQIIPQKEQLQSIIFISLTGKKINSYRQNIKAINKQPLIVHSGLYAVTRNRCGKHGQLRLTKLSIHSDEAAGLAIRNNYSDSVNYELAMYIWNSFR